MAQPLHGYSSRRSTTHSASPSRTRWYATSKNGSWPAHSAPAPARRRRLAVRLRVDVPTVSLLVVTVCAIGAIRLEAFAADAVGARTEASIGITNRADLNGRVPWGHAAARTRCASAGNEEQNLLRRLSSSSCRRYRCARVSGHPRRWRRRRRIWSAPRPPARTSRSTSARRARSCRCPSTSRRRCPS